jgi:hypothetical protein
VSSELRPPVLHYFSVNKMVYLIDAPLCEYIVEYCLVLNYQTFQCKDKLHTIIRKFINIEQYNFNVLQSTGKFNLKWSQMECSCKHKIDEVKFICRKLHE